MNRSFDWADVPVFLSVAEHGSLAKAATALRASTATISRRLEALETAIGQRLFDRLPNRVVLTDAGRELLASATRMRDAADALERDVRRLDGRPAERVRITATQSMSMFLVPHLGALRARCPGTTIELVATRAQLSLARREADIALRMGQPPEVGDLVVRKLGAVARSLYAAVEVASASRRADGGYDLAHLPVIASMAEPALSDQEAWLAAHFDRSQIAFRISETRLRLSAAASGLGAAILSCAAADADVRLVRLVPPPAVLLEDAYLLMHRDLKDLPAIRAVAGALAALFKGNAKLLAGEITG
jgi:DNA-binding transcriptional LysR family regulator